jgi:DNA modification methylase
MPYPGNPRLNDDAVDAVAASLKEFGFRQPIVVDGEGVIVCGHTRYKAAIKLGLEKVPVHVAKDLSPEQVRAYRIADNQTASLATWNYDLLPIELAGLKEANYDLGLLGFDPDELAKLLDPTVKDGLTDPDQVPAPPDAAITQPGDLWILGNHRLLCGDSSNPADVDCLLGGASIHLVNTDPPYNVKVEPRSNNAIAAGLSSFPATKPGAIDAADAGGMHHQGFDLARDKTKSKPTTKKLRPKDRPLANDFVSDEAFDGLLDAWFGNMARVLEPGRGFYIWGGYANLGNYPPFLKKHGLYFSQGIVWDKQHPVLTRKDFMGAFELCQPPDTSVLTLSGSSAIQNLRDGDQVVSFSRHHSMMVGFRQGLPIHATSRDYDGTLYGIAAGQRLSWCTAGHIWSVRMTPASKSKWCVYLMQRGNWWRVGRAKMYTTWGLGVKQRLAKEDGDSVWILRLFDSKDDASTFEQYVSVAYGIPTTFWTVSRATRRTDAMIRSLYERLDLDQMERGARAALEEYGRNVYYPFLTRGQTRHKYSHRVGLLVRGCNLLPDVMAVPLPSRGQATTWQPIRALDIQHYQGPVYSMNVEKYHHYVADGIVTHNCFYGWKEGAGHLFLGPNNVTDLWHVKKVNPQSMIHLTEKPVELAVRAMQYSSREGEHVLDLFGGSGSTLIAAEQTGRKAFLMELDPLYSDVIVTRWEQFTGRKAERIAAPQVASPEEVPA